MSNAELKGYMYPAGGEDLYVAYEATSLKIPYNGHNIHKFLYLIGGDYFKVMTFKTEQDAMSYIENHYTVMIDWYKITTIREYISPESQVVFKLLGEIPRQFFDENTHKSILDKKVVRGLFKQNI